MSFLFNLCFAVGLGYAIISFLIGRFFEFTDIGAFLGGDFDGSLDSDLDTSSNVSPLKLTLAAVFLAVFGGVGSLLLLKNVLPVIALMIAFVTGMLISYSMYSFILVPLNKLQNTSAVEKQSLIGVKANVVVPIPQGHYGKIRYCVNGNTYTAPSKSEDGSAIGTKDTVEIVYIEKNTFYVRRTHSLLNKKGGC